MLRISRQRLAAKEESSRRSGLLLHEGFDELGDFLLLTTRQLRRRLKHQLQAAFGRLLLRLGRREAEQRVGADVQRGGELGQDFAAGRLLRPFPKGDVRLRHAELVGELLLREASGLPQFSQVLPGKPLGGKPLGSSLNGLLPG